MKHKVAIYKPTPMNHYCQWIYLDSKQHPPSAMGKVQRWETFPKGKTPCFWLSHFDLRLE